MPKQMPTKSLTVRVPSDLWKSVRIKCVEDDTSIQQVVTDFLNAWTKGKVEVKGPAK